MGLESKTEMATDDLFYHDDIICIR